jgi:hypothetical protein
MKTFFIAVILIACSHPLTLAQNKDLIRVRAGHTLKEDFPAVKRYRYPQYSYGQVFYNNGSNSGSHPFNYDLLSGLMLIIQQNGDTAVVTDQPEFHHFVIDRNVFCRVGRDQYAEIIAEADSVSLAVRAIYVRKRPESKASDGYGTLSQANTSASSYNLGAGRLAMNEDVLFTRNDTYYFIDRAGISYTAGRSRLLKLFPSYKKEISDYLAKNDTGFHSREDLLKLFAFCSHLKNGSR